MSTRVSLSPRDRSLLRLLSWTPATTTLLLRASETFEGGPFGDERRLRERLQTLRNAGAVRIWSTAQAGGGLQNYYKLTPLGFELLSGPEAIKPPRAFFAEVSPSLFCHTFRLAEVIVETVCACHVRRVTVESVFRENELTFGVGERCVQPDAFFRLVAGGRRFHVAFEVDCSTESLDSNAATSIRQKLSVYDSYQEQLLWRWVAGGKIGERPRFRVVFLPPSVSRAYHILSLAGTLATNRSRRLVYAAMHEAYVTEADRLFSPLFLDHTGHWQALVDPHPTAAFKRSPVRLTMPVESTVAVC